MKLLNKIKSLRLKKLSFKRKIKIIKYFITTLNLNRSQNRKLKLIVAYKLCKIPDQILDKYDAKTFSQPFVSCTMLFLGVFLNSQLSFFHYDFIHTCEAQCSKYFIYYRTQTL